MKFLKFLGWCMIAVGLLSMFVSACQFAGESLEPSEQEKEKEEKEKFLNRKFIIRHLDPNDIQDPEQQKIYCGVLEKNESQMKNILVSRRQIV